MCILNLVSCIAEEQGLIKNKYEKNKLIYLHRWLINLYLAIYKMLKESTYSLYMEHYFHLNVTNSKISKLRQF